MEENWDDHRDIKSEHNGDELPRTVQQSTGIFNQGQVFFILCAALLIFASLVGVVVFFLSVHGAEEVMVPDVQNKDIVVALLELQTKELDARIQLRYSELDRGGILEQDPKPGTIVRAGRKIRLVVSQGSLLSKVDFYTGRKLDDVRGELAALFGGTETPLIKIKEPVLYQFSTEPAGTILEQDPLPSTGISGQTELSLIISKGVESEHIEMPLLTGVSLQKAMELIGKSGIRWIIETRVAGRGEAEGLIVAQEPAGGDVILLNQTAKITVAEPSPVSISANETAGLFEYTLPEAPYPMQTVLEVITPDGIRQNLVNVRHTGGTFRWPYHLTKGSILVLSLLNREIYRETVQ